MGFNIDSNPNKGASFHFQRGPVGCILIHGFVGTPWSMRELGNYLAEHNITVSCPLLPGHGTHPKDLVGVSWDKWVDRIRREILEMQNQCDEVYIIGHSMGGAIALYLSSFGLGTGVISLSALIKIPNPWFRLFPVVRPFIWCWKRKKDKSILPEMGYNCYPLAAVDELKKMLRNVNARLSNVVCPVLIIHAEGDKRVPETEAEKIIKGVGSKHKKRILLKDPCHLITKGEDQEQVQESILQFIKTNSRQFI